MSRQWIVISSAAAAAIVAGGAIVLSQQPSPRPGASGADTAAAVALAAATGDAAQNPRVIVYKSPSCGCCGAWVDYMRANGFTVEVHDQDDVSPIKRASAVPEALESCHTAQVGGYVIEGHVPVAAIRRMLRERPAIAGLAVAGMVAGTPGMEMGNQHPPYEVTSFTREGRTAVYERH